MTKKLAQKFATKLQLIPLSSASIHPFPSRSFLEINFTASKLNGQVPTTTAILTVHHLVNWKRNPPAGQEQTRKEKLLRSKSVMYEELLSPQHICPILNLKKIIPNPRPPKLRPKTLDTKKKRKRTPI